MVSMAGIHGLLVTTSTRRVAMLFLFYSLQSDAPTPLLSTLGSAAALVRFCSSGVVAAAGCRGAASPHAHKAKRDLMTALRFL